MAVVFKKWLGPEFGEQECRDRQIEGPALAKRSIMHFQGKVSWGQEAKDRVIVYMWSSVGKLFPVLSHSLITFSSRQQSFMEQLLFSHLIQY